MGSLKELEYMLDISKALNYIDDAENAGKKEKIKEISKMLNGLISALNKT